MNLFFHRIFTLSFLLFIGNNAFSQEKNHSKNYFWIKNQESKSERNKNSSNDEEDSKKYFNFNPVVDFAKNKIEKKYKKIITKNASFFVVYKSDTNQENILILMERGSFKSSLSNKKLISDKEIVLNNSNPEKGVIVSYLFNKNSLIGKKNGDLIFDDLLFKDKEFKNQLLELIYIPKPIDEKEKSIIESYLSLKYGISLGDGKNYFNSKGETIWDTKENIGYNNNITGIGKDEYLELNQKQSRNSKETGLIIGFNKITEKNSNNETLLKNNQFLLWGDNGKNIFLEKSNDIAQKRMKRIWKIKSLSDSITSFKTQFKIEKKTMPIDSNSDRNNDEFIWLAIDSSKTVTFNFEKAKFIKASINNEKEIIFNNIEFKSNSDYLFTIVKAKESDIATNALITNNFVKSTEPENNLLNQVVVYPNPINSNEKFNLEFNLKEDSNTTIQISDVNGKIIKEKNLGAIKNHLYSESLSVSGIYFIIVSVNGKSETRKLIVK